MQLMQLNSSVSVTVTAAFIQTASVAGNAKLQNCSRMDKCGRAEVGRFGARAIQTGLLGSTNSHASLWREDASTLHGLCVENHPKLLGLACLTTASPSRASQLAGWLASRPITCMLRLQRASVRRSHSRRYQQAS